jgi:hypothetical protein
MFVILYTTLAWWRPITFGNLRYFASAAPALAVLAAAGTATLMATRSAWGWATLIAVEALTLTVWNRLLYEDFTFLSRLNLLPALATGVLFLLYSFPASLRTAAPLVVAGLSIAGLVRDYGGTLHLQPTAEHQALSDAAGRIRFSPSTSSEIPMTAPSFRR